MFKKRLISAVILVAITLAVFLIGGPVLAAVLMIVSVIAFHELITALGVKTESQKKVCLPEAIGYLFIVTYYTLIFLLKDIVIIGICLLIVLTLLMFVYVFTFPRYHSESIMFTFFALVYAPIMFSFIYLTRELENGIYIVWLIFISSWVCDTCAYACGMLFGKHKLTPRLSPKKSIEGAVGGTVCSALAGAIYGWILFAIGVMPEASIILHFAIVGGIGSVIAQIGDLAASAIKRNHDIKDYGKLIPGHGGIMDRFDSVIFTAPMIYFMTIFLASFL